MTDQSCQNPTDPMRERVQDLEHDINELLYKVRSLTWTLSSLCKYMDYNGLADASRFKESIQDLADLIEENSDKAGNLTSDLVEHCHEIISKLRKMGAKTAYLAEELSDVADTREDRPAARS